MLLKAQRSSTYVEILNAAIAHVAFMRKYSFHYPNDHQRTVSKYNLYRRVLHINVDHRYSI